MQTFDVKQQTMIKVTKAELLEMLWWFIHGMFVNSDVKKMEEKQSKSWRKGI